MPHVHFSIRMFLFLLLTYKNFHIFWLLEYAIFVKKNMFCDWNFAFQLVQITLAYLGGTQLMYSLFRLRATNLYPDELTHSLAFKGSSVYLNDRSLPSSHLGHLPFSPCISSFMNSSHFRNSELKIPKSVPLSLTHLPYKPVGWFRLPNEPFHYDFTCLATPSNAYITS